MGYTHYLQRPLELENFEKTAKAVEECYKIVRSFGIDIVGGHGEPDTKPEFSSERIWFNGSEKQTPGVWTAEGDFGIVWPSDKKNPITVSTSPVNGQWFGGAMLEKRVAPNCDGSYETLHIPRTYEVNEWSEADSSGNYFEFCKTAYRPYDLLVMCAYLATRYYDRRCVVSSDGESIEWQIAVGILSKVLSDTENLIWKLLKKY
ncbi:hypothetical protein [Okeania sp. SIO1I7]|uniref:hypothetical protein n=1 Tax=Okeania sp. SIO1I7 TaxID=2607772 RepID=UPI0013FA6160|nr:hypothetical protein [Okeania sp. SIO1I7]NET30151.1 hypothetical protein [Okeania sp. SIO1I7]